MRPLKYCVILLSLALGACAGRPIGNLVPIVGAPPTGASRVDLLVATTRSSDHATVGEMFTGERGILAYADMTVSIPPDSGREIGEIQWPSDKPGNPAKDFVTLRADRIPVADARRRFSTRIAAHKGRVLLFVHGYNTKYEEAVYRLAQIAHDSNAQMMPVLFTWPSRAKLLAYPYDRESANYSRDALEEVLQSLEANPQVREVAILAHSMGNWVTVEALRQMAIRKGRISPKIKTVMLAAPDVDVDVFQRQIAAIGPQRPPFVLFTSRKDVALTFSSRVWGSTVRLGAIDPAAEPYRTQLARDRILAVDLTEVESKDPLRHSTFAQSPEIVRLIGGRLAAGQALSDGKAGLGDRLGLAVSGAVDTVGQAATLAVSAPLAVVDPRTRETMGERLEQFGVRAAQTVTLKDLRDGPP
jgi:esterase/lipase superfamily enzyme